MSGEALLLTRTDLTPVFWEFTKRCSDAHLDRHLIRISCNSAEYKCKWRDDNCVTDKQTGQLISRLKYDKYWELEYYPSFCQYTITLSSSNIALCIKTTIWIVVGRDLNDISAENFVSDVRFQNEDVIFFHAIIVAIKRFLIHYQFMINCFLFYRNNQLSVFSFY